MQKADDALIADPVAAWDTVADLWDAFVETGLDYWRTEVHGPALLAACGDLRGKHALDLGCGQGWFSRQLALRGARVWAVDMSSRQFSNALRHEAAEPLGIDYLQLDARRIADGWPAERFDLITACMMLQDTAHAGEILRAASQVLAPAGRMAISFPHPVTTGPNAGWVPADDGHKGARQIDHYFATGPSVLEWRMARLAQHWRTPRWHRTLEEWSALIEAAGLCITRIVEPRPTPVQIAANPSLEPASRIPYFLVLSLRHTDAATPAGPE
jgi:2-polyprenyl-3-methyl-5-hydroxy-6-metoxy-1,4-benzoquinol methylase